MIIVDATSLHWPGSQQFLLAFIELVLAKRQKNIYFLIHKSSFDLCLTRGLNPSSLFVVEGYIPVFIPTRFARKVICICYLALRFRPRKPLFFINTSIIFIPFIRATKFWHSSLHMRPDIFLQAARKVSPMKTIRLSLELLLDHLFARCYYSHIAPSEYTVKLISNVLNIRKARVIVAPHSLSHLLPRDISILPLNGMPEILYVASFDVYKNHSLVLCLFEKLYLKGYHFRLIFVGPMVSKPDLDVIRESFLYSLGMITLYDSQPFEFIQNLYSKCSAVLIFSEVETFGYPLYEAMSFGLPILILKRDYLPSFARDSFFASSDINILEALIIRLFTDPDFYQQASQWSLSKFSSCRSSFAYSPNF